MLAFNFLGLLAVYLLHRVQHLLPWNPAGMAAVAPHNAWNTAVGVAPHTPPGKTERANNACDLPPQQRAAAHRPVFAADQGGPT